MLTQNLNDITLMPKEVREILCADNDEIINLCKKAAVVPRRNNKGLTYFSYDDLKKLQHVKQMKYGLARISPNQVVENIISSLNNVEERISANILNTLDEKIDKKFHGVEGIVAELIKYQTENENLKNKVNELNLKNIHLKMELEKFKKIGFGIYQKKENKDYTI